MQCLALGEIQYLPVRIFSIKKMYYTFYVSTKYAYINKSEKKILGKMKNLYSLNLFFKT